MKEAATGGLCISTNILFQALQLPFSSPGNSRTHVRHLVVKESIGSEQQEIQDKNLAAHTPPPPPPFLLVRSICDAIDVHMRYRAYAIFQIHNTNCMYVDGS